MTHWVTRSILALMALGGCAVLAFGPRPAAYIPENRVRVQYWEKWTGLEAEQMKIIVKAFNDTVGK